MLYFRLSSKQQQNLLYFHLSSKQQTNQLVIFSPKFKTLKTKLTLKKQQTRKRKEKTNKKQEWNKKTKKKTACVFLLTPPALTYSIWTLAFFYEFRFCSGSSKIQSLDLSSKQLWVKPCAFQVGVQRLRIQHHLSYEG